MAPLRIVRHHFAEVDSTNDAARVLAESGAAEGTAVWGDVQRRGRGRHGREWVSEAGQNVLLSVVLRPSLPPDRLGLVTMAGAVAVADVVGEIIGAPPDIKWPNDVLIRGRKVSGMLLESATDPANRSAMRFVILGIGINVNQLGFPPPLDRQATSLALESGRSISRDAVVQGVEHHLERCYDSLFTDAGASVHASFVERLTGLGETVKLHFPGGLPPVEGRFRGVALDGGLELELPDGLRRTFYAGEVTSDPSL